MVHRKCGISSLKNKSKQGPGRGVGVFEHNLSSSSNKIWIKLFKCWVISPSSKSSFIKIEEKKIRYWNN